jgi:uncharacterized protein involved in copper resistance
MNHHNNGHGNEHEGHGNEHGGHDDHGGMAGMAGMDHPDHSGMTGMTGSAHSGHDMGSMDHGSTHAGGHSHHGTDHPKAPGAGPGADNPTLAGGTAAAPIAADAEAVLIALGLALAVGVLGGWLLRMAGPSAPARS